MPILFAVILIDLIGFGIVIPILPFLSPQLGGDAIDIALIISTYAVFSGLFAAHWGRLSDRWGRKPVMMTCLAGGALSFVFLGLATELWMIYAARAFGGAMAGNFGVASAMMADITTPKDRARGMGLIGAAFGLGLVLGPMLGGLLAGDGDSFTLPCIVAGAMSLLAIVAAWLFLPESLSAERRAEQRRMHDAGDEGSVMSQLEQTGNRLLLLQYVVHTLCISGVTYLVPLWMGDLLGWGAREVGVLFGIQGAIMAVMQAFVLAPAVAAMGELRLLRVAVTLFLGGISIAVFADTMPWMVASTFIGVSGATICMPLLNTLISQRTPAKWRGRILGTTNAASSWGRVLGPLIAGACLALFGYSGAWMGIVLVLLFYLGWALFYLRPGAET